MYKKNYRNEKPPEAPQPDYIGTPPQDIKKTQKKRSGQEMILYVAGQGAPDADVMIISSSCLEEEGRQFQESITGKKITQEAAYLKGQAGSVFKDIALSAGIDVEECYFTAWCKWVLPKSNASNPTKEQMAWGRPSALKEIKRVHPKVIICLGKKVFDEIVDIKINMKDARGGWFLHKETGARVYLMEPITFPVFKPEYIEKFRVDFREINNMRLGLQGMEIPKHPQDYVTITNIAELKELVQMWKEEQHIVFSVDCEWHGGDHVDGQLRSIQFCWSAGKACYIRFMDDELNYVFDVPYADVGEVLGSYLNEPQVKYIGHHFAADAPWMYTWLGLEYFDKCVFDSEFAQQTADEYSELGLERGIAMRYTDLGRYDLDLTLWKKKSKGATKNGYGFVPDDILIPYACRDVDAVMRAYPQIIKKLNQQGLLPYYYNMFHPFVTNIFVTFAILGLPIDIERLDELRKLYSYARDRLEIQLKKAMAKEAEALLYKQVFSIAYESKNVPVNDVADVVSEVVTLSQTDKADEAWAVLKKFVTVGYVKQVKQHFEHFLDSTDFNIRSSPKMRRWLYDVKGYTPIKSTSNKEKGLPSTAWSRVLRLPPAAQKEYNPSTDIQSLEILYETHGDMMLGQLLKLNAVGNITKQFLKEPLTDDTGQVTEERGLHESLCSDGRVHGQMSTTETGRPRSWNPNILNWPSYVNEKIQQGIQSALEDAKEHGELPEEFERYIEEKPPSIRSCVKAPDGWCFVESDYQTAEIRGLAFISGDEKLINIMTRPDQQYAKLKGKDEYVRVSYDDILGIPPGMFTEHLHTDADFELDDNGERISPKADLHWSLAEMVTHKPREVLNEKVERKGLGKVGNFSTAYGASPTTLERKIEQDTGIKPEEGTGQAILDALRARQPVAVAFLEDMEKVPDRDGKYRAASGRIRHCPLGQTKGREARRILAALGRELRNFPMQESVAATAARAADWLLRYFRDNSMKARPLIILYDSVVTLCPLEEATRVAELHQEFMCDKNTWTYHKRVMNYPIDTDYNKRWSTKPKGEEVVELAELLG